ncbi:MAG: diaminopimelate epimerase, partial [Bacteroidales bacterium]|nr:diaminopimelate epimerase [Bacteroidales bacterium]
MTHYLYSGAGNTFVVLDGRELAGAVDIMGLCAKYGTDGLMILHQSKDWDFEMEFFNPDGTGGMMCGNGGRCIVAFADYLGFKPSDGKVYHFKAGDCPHTGEILADNGIVKT